MIRENKIEACHRLEVEVKAKYKTIERVHCPILEADVFFNSDGLHHFSYRADGTPRSAKEKLHKLKLFPLVIPVIKNAIAITDERNIDIRRRRGKKSKLKKGKSFALVAKVGRKNPVDVRVIVFRIGEGQYTYRSVMKD